MDESNIRENTEHLNMVQRMQKFFWNTVRDLFRNTKNFAGENAVSGIRNTAGLINEEISDTARTVKTFREDTKAHSPAGFLSYLKKNMVHNVSRTFRYITDYFRNLNASFTSLISRDAKSVKDNAARFLMKAEPESGKTGDSRFFFVAKDREGNVVGHSFLPCSYSSCVQQAANCHAANPYALISTYRLPSDTAYSRDMLDLFQSKDRDFDLGKIHAASEVTDKELVSLSDSVQNPYMVIEKSEPDICNSSNSFEYDICDTTGDLQHVKSPYSPESFSQEEMKSIFAGRSFIMNGVSPDQSSSLLVHPVRSGENEITLSVQKPLLKNGSKTVFADIQDMAGKRMLKNMNIFDASTGSISPLNIGQMESTPESMKSLSKLIGGKTAALKGADMMLSKTPHGYVVKAVKIVGKEMESATTIG